MGSSWERILSLWKRVRRVQARLSAGNDREVDTLLGEITFLIDYAGKERLTRWKKLVETRRGAAKWIKSKMCSRFEPVLPSSMEDATFSACEIASRLAPELAERWNTGVHKFAPDLGGDQHSPELTCVTPPPPAREIDDFDVSVFDAIPAAPKLGK